MLQTNSNTPPITDLFSATCETAEGCDSPRLQWILMVWRGFAGNHADKPCRGGRSGSPSGDRCEHAVGPQAGPPGALRHRRQRGHRRRSPYRQDPRLVLHPAQRLEGLLRRRPRRRDHAVPVVEDRPGRQVEVCAFRRARDSRRRRRSRRCDRPPAVSAARGGPGSGRGAAVAGGTS